MKNWVPGREPEVGEQRAARPGRLAVFCLAAATAGLLAAPWPAKAAEPPYVVTTVGMIADVAANVGGDCVDVEALMGPGVDPHLYQASAGDVRTFQSADLILYSGYSLEGKMGDVLKKLASMKPTVAVSEEAIDHGELIAMHGLYGVDPHLWMDVSLWAKTVPAVEAALADLVPDCAADMEQRLAAYEKQLAGLHQWIKESVASIPDAQRILVTAHDAFNYYGRAYGIEVAGIQGISTESEAGIADIRNMVNVVVERKVPAVFIESTINPRTIQAVIDAAADRGQTVEIGGQLFSDAMGEAGTAGGTYIGMLFENTSTIVEALGGRPAPLPAALGDWAAAWNIDVAAR